MARRVRLPPPMLTWGDFKRMVDRQLADGAGDRELVKFIEWNGLEPPVVDFREQRGTSGNVVYVRVA
ncbi:MAG TPA: hypothetical protein VFS62_08590 [Chloroflexota bacterium]|nr:hypothetical protein [Chloroflexota bacterium]